MSLPRILSSIVITGSQILFTASREAYKQVGRNMRAGGSAMGAGSAVGVGAADSVSRTFKMTVDEACNILNLKKDIASGTADESALQELLSNYERMFKANEKTSLYIQSKIVRARERLEAELPQLRSNAEAAPEQQSQQPPAPPQ